MTRRVPALLKVSPVGMIDDPVPPVFSTVPSFWTVGLPDDRAKLLFPFVDRVAVGPTCRVPLPENVMVPPQS